MGDGHGDSNDSNQSSTTHNTGHQGDGLPSSANQQGAGPPLPADLQPTSGAGQPLAEEDRRLREERQSIVAQGQGDQGVQVERVLKYLEDSADRREAVQLVKFNSMIEHVVKELRTGLGSLREEFNNSRAKANLTADQDVTMRTVASDAPPIPQLSTVEGGATFLPPNELRQFPPNQIDSFFKAQEKLRSAPDDHSDAPRSLGLKSGVKLPTFDGSDYTQFANWDYRIRGYLNCHYVPESHQCAFIFQALVGQAATDTRHLAHLATPGSDPNTYLERLKEVFSPYSQQPMARSKYATCRQHANETIKEYANRLRAVFIDAFPDDPHEKSPHLVQHFIEGLANSDISIAVQRKNFSRYSKAVEKAVHEANILQYSRMRQGRKTATCDLGTPSPYANRGSGSSRVASIQRDSVEEHERPRVDTVRRYCDLHKTTKHGNWECRGRSPQPPRGRERSGSRDSRGRTRRPRDRSSSRGSPKRGILKRSKDRDRQKTRFSRKPRVANVEHRESGSSTESDGSDRRGDSDQSEPSGSSDEDSSGGVIDSLFEFDQRRGIHSLAATISSTTDDPDGHGGQDDSASDLVSIIRVDAEYTDDDDLPTDEDIPADYLNEDPTSTDDSSAAKGQISSSNDPLIGGHQRDSPDLDDEGLLDGDDADPAGPDVLEISIQDEDRLLSGDHDGIGLGSVPPVRCDTSADFGDRRVAHIHSIGPICNPPFPDLEVEISSLGAPDQAKVPDCSKDSGARNDLFKEPYPVPRCLTERSDWSEERPDYESAEAMDESEQPSATPNPDPPLTGPPDEERASAPADETPAPKPGNPTEVADLGNGRKRRLPSPSGRSPRGGKGDRSRTSAGRRKDPSSASSGSGRRKDPSPASSGSEKSARKAEARAPSAREDIQRRLRRIADLKREMDTATLYTRDREPSPDLRDNLNRRRDPNHSFDREGRAGIFGPSFDISHLRAECDRIRRRHGRIAELAAKNHLIRQLFDPEEARAALTQICDDMEEAAPPAKSDTRTLSKEMDAAELARLLNPSKGRVRYADGQLDPFRLSHRDLREVKRMEEPQRDLLHQRMNLHLHNVEPCPVGVRPFTEGELDEASRVASLQKTRRSFLRRLHREEVDLILAQFRAGEPLRDLLPGGSVSAR